MTQSGSETVVWTGRWPPRCRCYCCYYDAVVVDRLRQELSETPPNLRLYTGEELLACPAFQHIGPVRHCTEIGEQWWRTFQPVVGAWLAEELAGGCDDLSMAKFAAESLLRVPEARAWDGRDTRPEYDWAEIDAYEVLFENVVHGGTEPLWEDDKLLARLRSFAAYLTREGFIEPVVGASLDRGLEVWIPRLLAHYDDPRLWWGRDGTPRGGQRAGQEAASMRDAGHPDRG